MAGPQSFDPGNVTAAILAGGAGTRVGDRDKGLIVLAGRPLVAHVAERLAGQTARVLICANRNANAYAAHGHVIADVEPGFRGPLAGIAAACEYCSTPWLLTVPVDAPQPPPDLAPRLHAALARVDAWAAVLHDGRRREPLFALYRRDACASARAALQRNAPVWQWQDEIGVVEVDFSDCAADVVNLNSLDELRRWEARHA